MDPSVSVQKQTSQETQRSLQKFLEPEKKPKVIHTDNSLEFGKACEDLSWNHCTSTPHRSETNGVAERAVRRVKEGTSAVLLQSGLMKVGGQIPWNVTPICETSQIYYLMGRRPMKDVLENLSKVPLVHQSSITLSLRKTSPDSINLERKSYLDCSSDTQCTRGNLEGCDVLIADLEELETMEIHFSKELRQSTLIRDHPIRGEDQRHFPGESEGSPPPLHQDSHPNAGEARKDFWSMSEKLHIPPSRRTQSQTLLAERRSFHSTEETLTSPELLIQTWM